MPVQCVPGASVDERGVLVPPLQLLLLLSPCSHEHVGQYREVSQRA